MSSLELKIGDKSYDVTPPFTNRELHIIKQIAGVRAGELFDAIEGGDNDVIVALAHIAVRRKNTARPSLDELWEMEAGEIVVEEHEDAVDPTTEGSAPPAEVAGSPATIPADSGVPPSAVSSTLPRVTLAT